MTVTALWRFPVKSLAGHPVDELRIDRRAAHADRLWALRDLDRDITASCRRLPTLLTCSARYAHEPGPDAGPGNAPEVVITFPDGTQGSSSDADIHDRLSEVAGQPVRLTPLPPVADTSQHRMSLRQLASTYGPKYLRSDLGWAPGDAPDTSKLMTKQVLTLARFATPPGTFVDLGPVHLLSTNSLASLSPTEQPYDVRRFRPNILISIAGADTGYPEADWIGAHIEIGGVALHVTMPTVRCTAPSRPQPGVDKDRTVTRALSERTGRFLGIYADVTRTGVVRVGDAVTIRPAAEQSRTRRMVMAAGKAVVRRTQQVFFSAGTTNDEEPSDAE